MSRSVFPDWMAELPMQMQSVLVLGAHGPDNVRKHHPCKAIMRPYRATVLKAAKYGRLLCALDEGDSFMAIDRFQNDTLWAEDVRNYFHHVDEMPHHFHLHLMHGAEILGYKHPNIPTRDRWREFYFRAVDDLHLNTWAEKRRT